MSQQTTTPYTTSPASIPTTPPYVGTTQSNTIQPQYSQPTQQQPSIQNGSDAGINWINLFVTILCMILTGVVGYFSSLMSVKSDIAENKEHISVIETKVENINNTINDNKEDLKNINSISQKVAVIEVRTGALENTINKTRPR